jgi:integrase
LAHVEAIVAALGGNYSVERETAAWLAKLKPTMYEKLAAVDLVPKRERTESKALGAFLDAYIAARSDVKGDTKIVYGHSRRCLITFFGADCKLDAITQGDADEWRRWLARPKSKGQRGREGGQALADNTVRRRCAIAKQFFRAAVRQKLLAENPFGDMKGISVRGNKSREFFITPDMADKIIDACPDAQWRLIFVLSRYGGLRCPSEHVRLRWTDIDWANSRMTVHSPKTEHHGGKATRVVPIFPEVRKYLDEVWQLAPKGSEFVIARYRDADQNLRTTFEKIIKLASLKPWPKLFQNLRATRETELAEQYPIQVVCEWIGNSQAVAKRHYLQVTESHFAQAIAEAIAADGSAEDVAQNVAQSGAVSGRIEPSGQLKNRVLPLETATDCSCQFGKWAAQDSKEFAKHGQNCDSGNARRARRRAV